MIKTAILGCGTVGSGVAEVISVNSDKITRGAGQEIAVKYIVDVRDFPDSPFKDLMTKDFSVVENDPEVKIVVETIGGIGVAYDFTKRSLLAGKSVVTSNKELVATHGYELINIAKEKGVNYFFEASVGGGIPLLTPIDQCLAANRISEIYGILNGTTNYILTEMIKNGATFENALKGAQKNGYAEANPSADVEGKDACRKICILCALCFGRHMYPEYVPTEGITNVTLKDVSLAGKGGYKIKLLGRALELEDGKISAYVAPHLVRDGKLVAGVDGVMNGVVIKGNAVGEVMFYGAGAGKLPTASAVVADVIDAARHIEQRKDLQWEDGGEEFVYPADGLKSRWFISVDSSVDVTDKISGGELIAQIDGTSAYITGEMDKYSADKLAAEVSAQSIFRVID